MQWFCGFEVSECFHIIALCKILKQYQQNKQQTLKLFADNIHTVCDHYNHLLSFHNQYQDIYAVFEPRCVSEKCGDLAIYYRNRERAGLEDEKQTETETEKDIKYFIIKDIFQKIHCHIYHEYDIGY